MCSAASGAAVVLQRAWGSRRQLQACAAPFLPGGAPTFDWMVSGTACTTACTTACGRAADLKAAATHAVGNHDGLVGFGHRNLQLRVSCDGECPVMYNATAVSHVDDLPSLPIHSWYRSLCTLCEAVTLDLALPAGSYAPPDHTNHPHGIIIIHAVWPLQLRLTTSQHIPAANYNTCLPNLAQTLCAHCCAITRGAAATRSSKSQLQLRYVGSYGCITT